MQKFSQITSESKNNSSELTADDLQKYIAAANKWLTAPLKKILYMCQRYNLLSAESLDKIKNAKRGDVSKLVASMNIPTDDILDLMSLFSMAKKDFKLLPQYQSKAEFDGVIAGKLTDADLTIDLTTSSGRNAAAKMYAPLVMKIVNQYLGKSRMDKASLISAGMAGLADAMKDWESGTDNGGKVVAFKTYASYRIQQRILNDINQFGHSLSGTNWYASKEYGASLLDAISIDGLPRDDNGEFKQDYISSLGTTDPTGDEEKEWQTLYSILDKKFSQRDCDIFYRYMGLNGRKREKSKDIAKSYGMSEGNIRNSIVNKILKFLKTDKRAHDILQDIMDMYTEHLIVDLIGLPQKQIMEHLLADDTYILLEDINRWSNKTVFMKALSDSLKVVNSNEIEEMLEGDFNTIDEYLKKCKKAIILFLTNMYPTESFSHKTDVSLLEYMSEIQTIYQKYKVKK